MAWLLAVPAFALEFGQASRGSGISRRHGGCVALGWGGCIALGWALSPCLPPAEVHGNGSVVVERRGIGQIVLSWLGAVSIVKGSKVCLRIQTQGHHMFQLGPILIVGKEREDPVVDLIQQPFLKEVHYRLRIQVIFSFSSKFFEQGNVLIHVIVLEIDIFDLCFGVLLPLGVEEVFIESAEEIVPWYDIIMLASDPVHHL